MAIDIVDATYLNGSTRLVLGEVVKILSTKRLEKSIASATNGTIGVVMSGSVAALAPDVVIALSGTTPVFLEDGLTPSAGQILWLSASVAGRATNIQPGGESPPPGFPIGTITDAGQYTRTGRVIADVNSLSSVVAAAAGTGGATGVAGATGATGATGAGATGATGSGATGATGAGATGATGVAGAAGGISKFAMFFGLTAGTGSAGTDYAATVAVKTGAGTGRVPFPQDGPAAGIVRVDGTSFTLPDVGTYAVTYRVHTTEPGQLNIEINGTDVPQTEAVNMNPTSGGHPIVGDCLITTVAINAVLAVVNSSGNAAALTVTPADGSRTHANSQTLTILRVA